MLRGVACVRVLGNYKMKRINDELLGKKLKDLRKSQKKSLETVASRVGLTSAQLLKYEHGINRISAQSFALLADALDTPIDALVYSLLQEHAQSNVA